MSTLSDLAAGVVKDITGPFIVLEYPERPEELSPFPNVCVSIFRYGRGYKTRMESWVVLAAGYPPVLVQYPKSRKVRVKKVVELRVKIPGVDYGHSEMRDVLTAIGEEDLHHLEKE
jgi:hypothetical protein